MCLLPLLALEPWEMLLASAVTSKDIVQREREKKASAKTSTQVKKRTTLEVKKAQEVQESSSTLNLQLVLMYVVRTPTSITTHQRAASHGYTKTIDYTKAQTISVFLNEKYTTIFPHVCVSNGDCDTFYH